MAITITEPSVVITEGDEDARFFRALAGHLAIHDLQIMGIGGKTKLTKSLKGLKVTPGYTEVISLGITRDADDDSEAAFASVCGALRAAALPVPSTPLSATADTPRVTVMILPETGRDGMLEDLCIASVADHPAMPCLEEYFDCIERNISEQDRPPERSMAKAKVHAFLASKREPDKRLGEAAEADYWPLDSPAYDEVKRFIELVAGVATR